MLQKHNVTLVLFYNNLLISIINQNSDVVSIRANWKEPSLVGIEIHSRKMEFIITYFCFLSTIWIFMQTRKANSVIDISYIWKQYRKNSCFHLSENIINHYAYEIVWRQLFENRVMKHATIRIETVAVFVGDAYSILANLPKLL